VYGYLHFFVLEGFVPLSGLPAMAVSLGCTALALGWATHLWQRHWSSAGAAGCKRLRVTAYWAWACMWMTGLVVELLGSSPNRHSAALAIAPDADWFLAPLPWLWPHFLGFAADRVVGRLFVIALCCGLLGALCLKLRWNKLATALFGAVVCMLGAYFLGDASYQYAAARKLQGLAVAELSQSLAANPGRYNGWTFVCWWGGWAFIAMGTLAIAAGLFIPAQILRQGQRH